MTLTLIVKERLCWSGVADLPTNLVELGAHGFGCLWGMHTTNEACMLQQPYNSNVRHVPNNASTKLWGTGVDPKRKTPTPVRNNAFACHHRNKPQCRKTNFRKNTQKKAVIQNWVTGGIAWICPFVETHSWWTRNSDPLFRTGVLLLGSIPVSQSLVVCIWLNIVPA